LTKKLFCDGAYMKEFGAIATSVEDNKIALDQTAFHPHAGGLVGDTGTLSGTDVMDRIRRRFHQAC
jgi:Ser-tRNA(Ala) deacylase AlaX